MSRTDPPALRGVSVDAVLIGQVRPFGPKGVPSGIDKRQLIGSVLVMWIAWTTRR